MPARERVTARSVHPTRLPRAIKPGLLSRTDWTLLACMLMVGCVVLSAVLYLDLIYRPAPATTVTEEAWLSIPREPPRITLARRLRTLGERSVPRQPTQAGPREAQARRGRRRAPTAAQIRRQIERAVLRLLAHRGRGGRLVDLLEGGHPDTRLARAFDGIGGTRTASRRPMPGLRTGTAAPVEVDGLGRVSGPREQDTGSMVRERVPRPLVRTEAPGPGCPLPEPSIMPIVRRGLPAIRACYERQLRRSPTIEGKISLRLQIDPLGRVRELEVACDTLDHPLVSSCIVSHARRWRFPPMDRVAEVTIPLLLRPGR